MPKISEFYGIVISMYHVEHGPPHFHAEYAGASAGFALDGQLLNGKIHPRARRLVHEWARQHRAELEANWSRARNGLPLVGIAPLK